MRPCSSSRQQNLCRGRQGVSSIAASLRHHHLPLTALLSPAPTLSSSISDSARLSVLMPFLCQLLCCTTVHCPVKTVSSAFRCLVFIHYWPGKYYEPSEVQYYMGKDCQLVPKLTLLVL